MSQRARDSVRLSLKRDFGRRKVRLIKRPDGRRVLKWKARMRAVALAARPINGAALAVAFLLLLAAETPQALVMVLALAGAGLLIERMADGPHMRRGPRIVRDLRPLLARRVIVVPQQKRAARIIRARPSPIVLGLPPSRPRSRIIERRPGPFVEECE